MRNERICKNAVFFLFSFSFLERFIYNSEQVFTLRPPSVSRLTLHPVPRSPSTTCHYTVPSVPHHPLMSFFPPFLGISSLSSALTVFPANSLAGDVACLQMALLYMECLIIAHLQVPHYRSPTTPLLSPRARKVTLSGQ